MREKLRILFLDDGAADLQTVTRLPILLGRHPSGTAARLALPESAGADEHHALLDREDGRWWIEDLASTTGTFVDGRDIRGAGRVELPPGAMIRTGAAEWIPIPGDWLFAQGGPLLVFGPCSDALSFAAVHCGVPLIGGLTLLNPGPEEFSGGVLELEVEEFSEPLAIDLSRIPPGSRGALAPPELRFHRDRIKLLSDPVETRLTVRIAGKPAGERGITVLGFWDFALAAPARRTLAAFVSPRNPVVSDLVSGAERLVEQLSGSPSFDDLLRSGGPAAEQTVLRALYRALTDRHRLRWIRPEISHAPALAPFHQTIRPAHRMFPRGFGRELEGTCLDLAVLMAAGAERVGLLPVIVLLGNGADFPAHAVSGCWIGALPGAREVDADRGRVAGEVRAGNVLLVEWTAADATGDEPPDFDRARAMALERVESADRLVAIDVGALRPPGGDVSPMDCSYEPEVNRALDVAESLARAEGREVLETIHLFRGLLAAGGEIVRWLFAELGLDPLEVCRAFADPRPDDFGPRRFARLMETRSFHECLKLAEELALRAGVPSVREQDLLWALLTRGWGSRKLRNACEAARIDGDHLAEILGRRFPGSHFNDTMY